MKQLLRFFSFFAVVMVFVSCASIVSTVNKEAFDFAESKGVFDVKKVRLAKLDEGQGILTLDSLFSISILQADGQMEARFKIERAPLESLFEKYLQEVVRRVQYKIKHKKAQAPPAPDDRLVGIIESPIASRII